MCVEYLSGGRIQGSSTVEATPDYESVFTTGTWTAAGTTGILSETSGSVTATFDSADDFTDSQLTFDLGSTISDTKWILRVKVVYTHSISAPANAAVVSFGVSDTTTISGHNERNGNDVITSLMHLQDDTNNAYVVINSVSTAGNNRVSRMSTGNTYYMQLQRLSVNSAEVKVFSDSTYTTQIGTTSSIGPDFGLTGGRYVFVHFFSENISSGTASVTLSDWKLYDNTTTTQLDEKTSITNVPTGTRYEETDTRKIYTFNTAGQWKELGTT